MPRLPLARAAACGGYFIWLRLNPARGPAETYSEAIIRFAEEGAEG
jgi:hypothetical protein